MDGLGLCGVRQGSEWGGIPESTVSESFMQNMVCHLDFNPDLFFGMPVLLVEGAEARARREWFTSKDLWEAGLL